jgi:uncharacterized protein YprB with RNaseH-like and TPR domain
MDIETIDMDHEKDELITFGMIERNELHVIQRRLKDPAAFYAYLSEFEKGFLSKQLSNNYTP